MEGSSREEKFGRDARDVELLRQKDRPDVVNIALGDLMGRYQNFVRGIVRARGVQEADVDSVVTETFYHALVKIDQLKDPYSFHAWLRVIADRKAINFLVKNAYRQRKLKQVNEEYPLEEKIDEDLGEEDSRRELAECLQLAIKELKPLDYLTISQFYLEHLSIKQMAVTNMVPLGTIKSRLYKARESLYAILKTDPRLSEVFAGSSCDAEESVVCEGDGISSLTLYSGVDHTTARAE